jgi:hypothetical protein
MTDYGMLTMRFKDEDDGDVNIEQVGELPTEWPYAVILEDMQCKYGTMYIATRTTVYRIDSQKFMRWLARYSTQVPNDDDNMPSLDKVDMACRALYGAMKVEL